MSPQATDQTPALETRNVVKDFPGVRALDGVSFAVHAGEIHALVGENGAGKSTLIRALTGEHPHGSFAGEIRLRGRPAQFLSVRDAGAAGIAAVHQELALVKHMTVAENIFLGREPVRRGLLDWEGMFHGAAQIMAQLGIDVDVRSRVLDLGVGAQQMVEIARAIHRDSPILILDEPTAALAEHEIAALSGLLRDLRRRGVAVVYISHKLDEVLALADRITVLRDGRTVATQPVADWTRDALVSAMVGRALGACCHKEATTPGAVVLEVEHLTVAAPEVHGHLLLDDVSFSVRAGEILGVAGLMGAGRTELLSTVFGAAPGPWSGTIRVDGRGCRIRSPREAVAAGLALVPEDRKRHGLTLDFSVLANLSMVHLREFCVAGWIDPHLELSECRRSADSLGVRAASLHDSIQSLSGGNQQKTVLGKWLLRRPRVLLLDEPTRGIDVGAKAEIHRLISDLTAQGMAVIMASSELPEVLNMADRILVLRAGRVSAELPRAEATAERVLGLSA